jgi:6-phosphogluconolactonase
MTNHRTSLRTYAWAVVLLTMAIVLAPVLRGGAQTSSELLVYIGTYTGARSKGIHVSRLDMTRGTLAPAQLAIESDNPSFLAVLPGRDMLYAANEVSTYEGKPTGSVTAYRIDRGSGKLTTVNRQSSLGGGPAHVVVDHAGKHVLVANYGGGSVAVLPLGADGALQPATGFMQHTGSGANPERQKQPHAHSINLDASDRFVYAADLGIDKVMIYRMEAKGLLTANDPAFAASEPGSGPRHLALHPSGRFAYVINELTVTVTAFARDAARGGLTPIHTISTLPSGLAKQAGYSTAEVQVHPSGRFLYGSNRGHDSIAVFAIDEKTGRLTFVDATPTQGKTPRNFGIDPSGRYLLAANQNSDTVVVFAIDAKTGRLTPTGSTINVGAPVCIKFVGRNE